jgi:hypothetical protein
MVARRAAGSAQAAAKQGSGCHEQPAGDGERRQVEPAVRQRGRGVAAVAAVAAEAWVGADRAAGAADRGEGAAAVTTTVPCMNGGCCTGRCRYPAA